MIWILITANHLHSSIHSPQFWWLKNVAMQESSSLQFLGIVSYHRKREGGVRFSTGSCVNTMSLISWKCKPIPRVCTRRTVSSSAWPFYSPPSYILSPFPRSHFLLFTFLLESLVSFFFIFNYITHFFPCISCTYKIWSNVR